MWFSSHSHSAIDSAVPRSRPEWRWPLWRPGITAWIDASTRGADAAAGCPATSSTGPTAAITPSTTSTEPGSWTVRVPSIGRTMPPSIRTVRESAASAPASDAFSRRTLDEPADLVEVAGAPVVVDPRDEERVLGQRDDLGAGQLGLPRRGRGSCRPRSRRSRRGRRSSRSRARPSAAASAISLRLHVVGDEAVGDRAARQADAAAYAAPRRGRGPRRCSCRGRCGRVRMSCITVRMLSMLPTWSMSQCIVSR